MWSPGRYRVKQRTDQYVEKPGHAYLAFLLDGGQHTSQQEPLNHIADLHKLLQTGRFRE